MLQRQMREEDEEDIRSYWMTVRKREDIVNWNSKHQISLCEELDLEEAVDMYGRLRSDDVQNGTKVT